MEEKIASLDEGNPGERGTHQRAISISGKQKRRIGSKRMALQRRQYMLPGPTKIGYERGYVKKKGTGEAGITRGNLIGGKGFVP